MLGTLRKQLRLISYYSAPRRRTRAAQLSEWALLAALILCVPVAFLIDRSTGRVAAALVFEGRLVIDSAGQYHAGLIDLTSNDVDPIWYVGDPVAEFDIVLAAQNHGWPITTSRSRAPTEITFTPFDPDTTQAAALASNPAVLDAIEILMRDRAPRIELPPFGVEAFSWEAGRRVHSPLGWVYASFMWFVLLVLLFMGPLLLTELLLRVRSAARQVRDHDRRERGLCTQCGYDLTGNEFTERCPECGALV